jgi:hypothetical protein
MRRTRIPTNKEGGCSDDGHLPEQFRKRLTCPPDFFSAKKSLIFN